MRRMSDGVEAGLHCMLVLAGLPENALLSGKHLAELHGLSDSYLLKHLRALTSAGVLDAVQGPKGGYRLARPPDRISLLDVVEAIDGSEPFFLCREIRRRGPGKATNPCVYAADCFIKKRMLNAERIWRDALSTQTVADMVRDGEAQIDDHNKAAVANYVAEHRR